MYYSKNQAQRSTRVIVPENYSGNAFRVKDESDRRPAPKESEPHISPSFVAEPPFSPPFEKEQYFAADERTEEACERENPPHTPPQAHTPAPPPTPPQKPSGAGLLSGIFNDIDLEDIIFLGLLWLLFQDDASDDALLLIIALLLLK